MVFVGLVGKDYTAKLGEFVFPLASQLPDEKRKELCEDALVATACPDFGKLLSDWTEARAKKK